MKKRSNLIQLIKVAFMLCVLATLWHYGRQIDPQQVKAALIQIGPGCGWIILSTFIAYTLSTLGWWYCLGNAKASVPKANLFAIRHVCESIGMFTPASVAGGDMLKMFLLKPYIARQATVVASIVISRLLMIVSQICLLVSAIAWLSFHNKLKTIASPVAPTFTGAVVTLGLFGAAILGIIKFTPEKWSVYFRSKLIDTRLELTRFYRQYPNELLIAFLLFALHWMVGSLEFYIVLKLFGYPISLLDALLLDMGVIAVKAAGAMIPGQLGVEELGNKLMLSLIGMASIPLWVSVSALRRARQLFWILVGVVFYWTVVQRKRALSKR